MRILVWATTFGADLWAFTRTLERKKGVTLRVVLGSPESYASEGIAELHPLSSPLHRCRPWTEVTGIPLFRPDVTIVDNHLPLRSTSPKGFVLWHGLGWMGPEDERELAFMHLGMRMAWGSAKRPNRNLRWQCFGPWDYRHRTEVSGIAPENCRILGAASHDILRDPMDRTRLQPFYPFDLRTRKTVLVAPTWHYGGIFEHWGQDMELLDRLLETLARRKANVIMRFHDSFRYDRRTLDGLEGLMQRHPSTVLKFKDRHPDNLLDLQAADVLITNFSSIANLFYATRRPTVHVYPVRSDSEPFVWRRRWFGGTLRSRVDSVRRNWKLPPEDNGGLTARSFDELLAMVEQALDDPTCCERSSGDFLERHMLGADGRNCERSWDALCELMEA